MTELVTQPTAAPTRKMVAVMLAALAVAGLRVALSVWAPDAVDEQSLMILQESISAAIIMGAGYFTRDRAPVAG